MANEGEPVATMTPKDPTLADAVLWSHGRYLEDFEVGQQIDHHWSKTFTRFDSILFSNLTLHATEKYVSLTAAEQAGMTDLQINPWLVFLTTFGLTVEDLSEAGQGAFLGGENVSFLLPVHPGDTISARSTVADIRMSESRPDFGIVSWDSEGINQHGDVVIRYRRTNFVIKRAALQTGTTLNDTAKGKS